MTMMAKALSQNGGIDGGGNNNTHDDGGANASSGRIDTCDNSFQGGGKVVNVGSDNNTHEGGRRVNVSGGDVDVGGDNVTHDGGKTNGDGNNNAQGGGKVDVGGDDVTHGVGGANGGGDNDAQGGGKVDASGESNTHGNGRANGGGGVDGGSHNNAHGDGEINGLGDNNANGDERAFGGGDDGSENNGHNGKSGNGGGRGGEGRGNDNSGDGVGGRNGNDGNEQGDDDDGGDNNECNGADGHQTEKAQNAIVKVQPGSRGYWYNREKQIRIDAPKDLKDVCITPYLSFEFLIDAHGLKTVKTTIYVLFDMKGTMPNENETKRFGWFQRQLEVSLECSEDGGAKLHGDGVLEQEDETQKRIWMENMQSNSGHIQFGMNGSVRGGLPVIQGELGGLFSRSMGTSSSMKQHTIEIPNKQISGGFVPIKMTSGGNKPCLSYKFNYMKYPKDINEVDNEAKRELYITTGLCSSLSPKVVGTWDELDDDKLSYLYTFEAQRIVCELKKQIQCLVY
jgi:hypothetical protein